jgi:hypothetical protein
MFKKSMLAIALAAATVPAMAAIDDQLTGNGELFLAVSNWGGAEASRVTYVFDTGIKMDDFLPVSSALGVTEASTLSDTSFRTALPNWNTFISQLTTAGGSVADLRFAVIAVDSTGANAATSPNSKRILTTASTGAGPMVADAPSTESFQNSDLNLLTSVSSGVSRFIAGTNLLATHNTPGNGVSINVRQGGTDNADWSNAFLDSLSFAGSQLNFTTGAELGAQSRFVFAGNAGPGTGSYNSRAVNAINYSLGNADVDDLTSGLAATFSVVAGLDGAELVYTAAIPEPGEWAFMMAGLSLAGLIARRRAAARRA